MSSKRKIFDYFGHASSPKKSKSEEIISIDSVSVCSNSDSEEESIEVENFSTFCAKVSSLPDSFQIVPGASDISQTLSEGPSQPKLNLYPGTRFGKDIRRFNESWYELFKWLEYSITEDTAYCFSCRFFSKNKKGPFKSVGFKNWKKALSAEGLKQHNNSEDHRMSCVSWINNERGGPSVAAQISNAHAKAISENRHYISVVVDVLRYLAVQGLALRGNDEGESSLNKGNFLELLNLISKSDEIVKKRLESGPQNAKYTHSSIQNELMYIMATLVNKKITQELEEAQVFAVMADETKDISKKEQLSIVVRYVFRGEVKERFLGFTALQSLNAESLFKYIKETLIKHQIDLKNCVAQTYDGASVMSGRVSGVQTRLKKEVPKAMYVHCMNHRLHLVLFDTCKNVGYVRDFISTLEGLYVFMSGSNIHIQFLDLQKDMGDSVVELKRHCPTRWTSHLHACLAVKKTLSPIIVLLMRFANDHQSQHRCEAKGLLIKIDFSFVNLLCLFTQLLMNTKGISDYLQSKEADMGKAILLVNSLVDDLKAKKTDNFHNDILNETKNLCNENGLKMSEKRKREIPEKLARFIFTEKIPSASDDFSESGLRTGVFLVVLDRIIAELEKRFCENSIIKGMSALVPESESFLNYNVVLPLAQFYELDISALKAEMQILPKTIKRYEDEGTKVTDFTDFLNLLIKFKLAFQESYRLAVITVTIPVSSASCERTFSCLKRLKSLARNRMLDARLSHLATLAIEKEETRLLDVSEVVNSFAKAHENRRIILQ